MLSSAFFDPQSAANLIRAGRICFVNIENDLLAGGASINMLVLPLGFTVHATWTVNLEGNGKSEIFEGPTVTDNGAALTIFNRNRNESDLTGVLAFEGPTVTNDGLLLDANIFTGGMGGNATIEEFDQEAQIILRVNTAYLARVTNTTGQVNSAHLQLNFFVE